MKLKHDQLKALNEPGYYSDGGGLYLQVAAGGSKSWVYRYQLSGKRRMMGLGGYPDVSLAQARSEHKKCLVKVRAGIDPLAEKKANRAATEAKQAAAKTFEQCASAYMAAHEAGWKNAKHAQQWRNTLETYAYPIIGSILVGDVNLTHVTDILEPIWAAKTETASRLRGRIECVLDYAIARGYRTGENPARWRGHLDKLLAAPNKIAKVEHHEALPYGDAGAFMSELRAKNGVSARALEFAILTVARSGEVRGARWGEIDLNNAVWTIPSDRMKAGKEHRVPLCESALKLLRALQPRNDAQAFVFPNTRGAALSDAAMTVLLRRMGYSVTAHGFRSTFRDWAGETTAYPREVIEHALAHQLADKAEAAYARGTLFDKRRRLMDDWSRYCDAIAAESPNVVSIRSATLE